MSYKKRNGLILLAFVLIISGVGIYFSYFHYPRRIEKINREIQQIESKIEQIPRLQAELESYRNLHDDNTEKLENLDKEIEAKVTPAMTYRYLDLIQNKFGSLQLDISFVATKEEEGYGYNSFTINGVGPFYVIMKFIWALEKGPKIYRITRLGMQSNEEINHDTGRMNVEIMFDMEIRAYFADVDFPPINRTISDVRMPSFKNPFWPLIYKGVPPNVNGLLEVDKAVLRAITPGKAIVVGQTGKVHTLRKGDKVYLGYVSKIDHLKNRVEFTLNKGGIYEKYYLTLNFEQGE